jgi:hypothetical protein
MLTTFMMEFKKRSLGMNGGCLLLPGFLIVFVLNLPFQPSTEAQTKRVEPEVSLKIHNRPLSEALAEFTRSTGTSFIIDPEWQKLPVTATIENTPLSLAVKRVLYPANHALVYRSQDEIEILIFQNEMANDNFSNNRPEFKKGKNSAPQDEAREYGAAKAEQSIGAKRGQKQTGTDLKGVIPSDAAISENKTTDVSGISLSSGNKGRSNNKKLQKLESVKDHTLGQP